MIKVFVIGQKGIEFIIIDVIIIPVDNSTDFLDEYRKSFPNVSNDELSMGYSSKEYVVRVIYSVDVNILAEDISTYKDRIS